MTHDVFMPNGAWHAAAPDRQLLRDLMGGTRTMRAAGERWLPREPNESLAAYRLRLGRAVLYNGLARAVRTISARPFARPVVLGEAMAPELVRWCADVDLAGRDLSRFAHDVFRAALLDGLTHVLVDMPADEAAGARPYLVHVPADNLIGWRTSRTGGAETLAEIRIAEEGVLPDGPWGERVARRVRVIRPDAWSLWEEPPRDARERSWRKVGDGPMSLGRVPLVTVHTGRTGPLTATPPLLDLAWLNLAHWQSAADQRHILHVARVPILFGRDLRVGEGGLEIGPNRMVLGEGVGADLRFVEHSGAAINAGRQDLIDLEERMARMGAELLAPRHGQMTATERSLEADRHDSALQAMVRDLEGGLVQMLGLLADWAGLPRSGIAVDVFDDFGEGADARTDLPTLLALDQRGAIDRGTLTAELRRRGVLEGGTPDDSGGAGARSAEQALTH
jgi:hypothetical protein